MHLFDGRSFDGQIESYDLHYNVAAVKIQSETALPIASLAHLSDSITINPSQLRSTEENSFQLRPHSNSFDLIPGDIVIALGRFYAKPYGITAAPGEFWLVFSFDFSFIAYLIVMFVIETSLSIIFMVDPCSIDRCDDDLECKELLKATCNIMRVTFFHNFLKKISHIYLLLW